MSSLTLEQIQEAFQKSGLLPLQACWQADTIRDNRRQHCGCVLTACYIAADGHLDDYNWVMSPLDGAFVHLGLDRDYAEGLIDGWDQGKLPETVEDDDHYFESPLYREGYDLGVAAVVALAPHQRAEGEYSEYWTNGSWSGGYYLKRNGEERLDRWMVLIDNQVVWSMSWNNHATHNQYRRQLREAIRRQDLTGLPANSIMESIE